MKRLKTGVDGLDAILGGIPKGRSTLIIGKPGCGKTIFALQFAHSCCSHGIKTLYISTEDLIEDLKLQGAVFGWNFEDYEKEKCLIFVEIAQKRISGIDAAVDIGMELEKENFVRMLNDCPEDFEVIIIDNIGTYCANLTLQEFKERFDSLIHRMRLKNLTSLMILEFGSSYKLIELASSSAYGVIHFMKKTDPKTGKRIRVIDIVKMKNTRYPIDFIKYEIGPTGIKIVE